MIRDNMLVRNLKSALATPIEILLGLPVVYVALKQYALEYLAVLGVFLFALDELFLMAKGLSVFLVVCGRTGCSRAVGRYGLRVAFFGGSIKRFGLLVNSIGHVWRSRPRRVATVFCETLVPIECPLCSRGTLSPTARLAVHDAIV